jgi:hypothetical protein
MAWCPSHPAAARRSAPGTNGISGTNGANGANGGRWRRASWRAWCLTPCSATPAAGTR